MKNRIIYIALLVLGLFSCNRQTSIKDFVERGFSKPTLGDADIKFKEIGDGGKFYVPSEKDIEVQFTIKNKYSKELTGKLDMSEDKKDLFSRPPEITELTPTKMVIAFNFKDTSEPNDKNNFLGEYVGMTVNIFEKSTGRFLSSQAVTLGCNTPPLAIKNDDIQYNEAHDEYVVTLRQGAGIHKDLKEVKFFLSTDNGGKAEEPKIINIKDLGEEVKQYTLEVQGNEKWQLANPKGQRTIKAVVYDKVGLKSDEYGETTKRYFTNITLIPSKIKISIKKANSQGVPVPSIKELDEFFGAGEWEGKNGYRVEYVGTGAASNIRYDSDSKTLKKDDMFVVGTYQVTVKLTQGSSFPVVSANYEIETIGSDKAEIDKSSSIIEDVTRYSKEGVPQLQFNFNELDFIRHPVDPIDVATVGVDYTGFVTDLKVHIVAISEDCRGKDSDGTSWGANAYQKDYTLTLEKEGESSKSLQFTIIAENNTEKGFKITFKRKKPVKVEVKFVHESLLPTSKAEARMSWTYGNASLKFDATQSSSTNSKEMLVAKDAMVNFDISTEGAAKIESCTSDDLTHTISPTTGIDASLSLKAKQDFVLTIKLKPEASVKWENYLKPQGTCGYTSGKITYWNGSAEVEYNNIDDTKTYAVAKGEYVKFSIEGLDPNYKIGSWEVDGEELKASKSDGSITLEDGMKSLTIRSAEAKDCVVSVKTKSKLPSADALIGENGFKVEDVTRYGKDFNDDTVQELSFATVAFTNDSTGNATANVDVPYTGQATNLKVKVKAISNLYEGIDWNTFTNAYENSTWGSDSKEYAITLPLDAGNEVKLKFKIVKIGDHDEYKEYVVTFKRGQTVKLTVQNEVVSGLSDQDIADVTIKYRDVSGGGILKANGSEKVERDVKSGDTVKIIVDSKNNLIISGCDAQPPDPNIPNTSEGLKEFSFVVTNDVTLTFKFSTYHTLTVTFKGLKTIDGDEYPHDYELKATKRGTTDEIAKVDSESDENKYVYKVVDGANVALEASIPGNPDMAKYDVEKWMRGAGELANGGTQADVLDINADTNVEIMLKPQYKIVLAPTLDARDGKISIFGSETEQLSTLETVSMQDPEMDEDKRVKIISSHENLFFKVSGIGSGTQMTTVVFSYKINDTEKKDFFDNTTGFWKIRGDKIGSPDNYKNLPLPIKPGDKFEVVTARVKPISLCPKNFATNSPYTINMNGNKDYIFKLTREGDSGYWYPFPDNNTLEIKHENIKENAKGYIMYITQGTKVNIELQGLNENKEIGEWRRGDDHITDEKFNEEAGSTDLRIGKTNVKIGQEGNDFSYFALNAAIRDKTYVLTVQMKDYYRKTNSFSTLLNEDNNKNNIKVELEMKKNNESVYGFLRTVTYDSTTTKIRFPIGAKIKLKAGEKGDLYYFAMWGATNSKGEDIIDIDSNADPKKKYSLTIQDIILPSENITISAYYTKHLIVAIHQPHHVHPGGNIDTSLLSTEIFPPGGDEKTRFGKTSIEAFNSVGNSIAKCNNKNTNEFENYVFGPEDPFPGDKFFIKDLGGINVDNAKLICVKLEHSNLASPSHSNKKVIWKYALGHNLDDKYLSNNTSAFGKPEYLGKRNTFEFNDPSQLKTGVLHLWLYKVE